MSKENQKIIPAYRFPNYNEEWIKKSLGQIGKPLMCKRIFKEQTTTDSNKNIPFFKIGTFGKEPDAYIPLDLFEEFKRKFSYPKVGDILISASGTIGRLVVYNGEDAYYQDSNIVWLGHDESEVLNSFLYYIYATLNWQTSDGGVIKRLYNSNIKEMEIFFPKEKKEQQKIADCLSSLDDLISAESDKLAQLKDHKKGLLQQLFPAEGETVPKLRFPEFKKDGEWEEKALEDCLDYLQPTPYLVNSSEYNDSYSTPVLTAGKTFILGYTKESEGIFKNDLPVIIFDDFTTASKFVNFPFKAKSSAMKILTGREGCNVKFLFEVMQTIKFEVGAHKRHWISIFSKLKVQVPSPVEQEKIADCLSTLDDSITAQVEKVDALKDHKKGLMQQLFPNLNALSV